MRRLRVMLITHDSKKADLVAWARGPARFHATTDEQRFMASYANRSMRPVGRYCAAGDEGSPTCFGSLRRRLRLSAKAKESRCYGRKAARWYPDRGGRCCWSKRGDQSRGEPRRGRRHGGGW